MKKLIFFCLLIFSCKDRLDSNITAAMQQFDNLVLHVNAKGIADMFTDDGVLAGQNGFSVHGRDSIEKFLDQFNYIKVTAQKSTTDSISRLGDTAFQYGKYYQRAVINKTTVQVHGMFKANWLILPGNKIMLQRMSAWSTDNK